MPVDPEYLRQHYNSLSDQALHAVNRADLVEAAQQCYDAEVGSRNPASLAGAKRSNDTSVSRDLPGDGEIPDWLEDAAEVYSSPVVPGRTPTPEVTDARDALEAAGIPCYLDLVDLTDIAEETPPTTRELRLRVPGNFNLLAISVLERDIFNQDFEAEWKTHLEMLTDQELQAVSPQDAFLWIV